METVTSFIVTSGNANGSLTVNTSPGGIWHMPKMHPIDWTKVKSLEELCAALNALDISVSTSYKGYEKVKHLIKDE